MAHGRRVIAAVVAVPVPVVVDTIVGLLVVLRGLAYTLLSCSFNDSADFGAAEVDTSSPDWSECGPSCGSGTLLLLALLLLLLMVLRFTVIHCILRVETAAEAAAAARQAMPGRVEPIMLACLLVDTTVYYWIVPTTHTTQPQSITINNS